MEISIGIGGAVRRNQEIGIVKIRGVYGRELDLNRKVGKLAGNSYICALVFVADALASFLCP